MNKTKAIDIETTVVSRGGKLEGRAWDVYANNEWFVVIHEDNKVYESRPVRRLKNGHQLLLTFNKVKAADACGFKHYDTALPDAWLREQAAGDQDKWDKVRSEHIWLYDFDRNGEPVNVLETLVTIMNHAFEGVK